MNSIAELGLISLLALFLVFHLLVLFKIIPFNIVWGGRLQTVQAMYRFEAISILVNSFLLVVILIHAKFFWFQLPQLFISIVLWGMTFLFALNTLGNLASKNKWEKLLFTPITLLMSFFSLVLAL